MIVKPDDFDTIVPVPIPTNQRESVFYTCAYVHDKLCSIAIDGGNLVNFASTSLVQELGLPTQKHPKPYYLRFDMTSEYRVVEQVVVPFSMGWYTDVIHCDVVPMDLSDLLLGRPWQYDRRTIHDGFNNTYTFQIFDKMVTLLPLFPIQILEAQILEASIPMEKTTILGDLPIQDSTNDSFVASKEEKKFQRDFFFLTSANVHNMSCFIEISSGSCNNFASTQLVQKMGLPTQKHPRPYTLLMYLSPAFIKVEEQVLVPISMECYSDVLLCDIIPMEDCYMLLGRSWQYDRRTSHDGYNNTYSFRCCDKMVTLYPHYRGQTILKNMLRSRQDMRDLMRANRVVTKTPKLQSKPRPPSLRPQRLRSKPMRFRDYVS